MTPSVSPEADWELLEGARFYTREVNAEVGLAFILEYERALALLCEESAEKGDVVNFFYSSVKMNLSTALLFLLIHQPTSSVGMPPSCSFGLAIRSRPTRYLPAAMQSNGQPCVKGDGFAPPLTQHWASR